MRRRCVVCGLAVFSLSMGMLPVNGQDDPGYRDWLRRDKEAWRAYQDGKKGGAPPRTAPPVAGSEIPPDEYAAAALIADGDETDPVVLPAPPDMGVVPDAGWAARLGSDPRKLIAALDGGRPGGDVSTMLALLRQTQGPFTDAEEQSLIKRFAPYAESDSEAAHAAIRQQNEQLLRAMIYRQMMIQSAWEYDFALADAEIARRMGDTESLEEAELQADIQRQMAQEEQKSLEALRKEIDASLALPTPEEVQAGDKAERDNAIAALELPAAPVAAGKVLLGYLKYEETHCEKGINDYSMFPPEEQKIIEMTPDWATFSHMLIYGSGPGKPEIIMDTLIKKYRCAWSIPKQIPLFGSIPAGVAAEYVNVVGLSVTLLDEGSKHHKAEKGFYLAMGVRVLASETGGPKPTMDGGLPSELGWGASVLVPVGNPGGIDASGSSTMQYFLDGKMDTYNMPAPMPRYRYVYFCIDCKGAGKAYLRYKWDPVETAAAPVVTQADPALSQEKNEAIAEHQANIASTGKVLQRIEDELAVEKNAARREELRLQALHMRQNIHDSKDLIESIRTGAIVKTRGPWDEHAAVVLAETSRKLREDCLRAQHMQAGYARMLKILERMKPEDAKRFYDSMAGDMIRGIHEPGGFQRAKKALNALHEITKAAAREVQEADYADQAIQYAKLAGVERDLYMAETIKRNIDRGIFVGSFFMGMGAGTVLTMAYEGSCTGIAEGPGQAVVNALIQGGLVASAMGVMKVGSWGIGKLLNPKVGKSQVNTFKDILEKARYDQEMEWNQALVNQVKERAKAFKDCKIAGGKDYLKIRMQLDEAVGAANSSALAKRIMKNELTVLQNQIKSGVTKDYSKLRECTGYQDIFNKRLQKSIYPRTDAEVVKQLQRQGYNVNERWFCDFRNSCSRGVNADRDFGLLYEMEGLVMKNGRQAPMTELMKDGQKAYNAAYKQVTGHSATLADQSFTTSAFNEAFPLSWLEGKMTGLSGPAFRPVRPSDFEKAGTAIYNKVQNALTGSDPALVNLKKGCASLSKDIKSKVFDRLTNPPASSTLSETSRKAALEHWRKVEKVMDDFASDKCDPLTAMKELQRLTGSTSVTESAAQVGRLVKRLGGGQ